MENFSLQQVFAVKCIAITRNSLKLPVNYYDGNNRYIMKMNEYLDEQKIK